ncbi:tetratricopeptide repeat-containing diguanylate cyclase [Janthinobacterium psychrotolerans]|uniref:tetratricopeptide repeat-containing diguanylate cyclase n=1 Tax=Janthinobacterium psychrotolerans TaxID=1747903 RepID=UPI001FDED091|nr:tetratricopeptide repeat-containing diguanylate cyclase [Janthinobacterium psychrotolerans]
MNRTARQGRRRAAWLLALCCLLPALAGASPQLQQRLDALREDGRFVPERALQRLKDIEIEAFSAPLTLRAEYITQLSNAHMRLGQNDIALQLVEDLILDATRRHNDVALAKALLSKAYISFALSERRASHLFAFEAETIANRTGDLQLRVQATISAGQSWAEEGNFPAALAKLQTAVDLARQSDSPATLAAALNALTLLYTQMREYGKGFRVLDELLAVAGKLDSPGRLAQAKNTEYGLALDANQPQRGQRALLEALALERRLGARTMVATTLVNLSDSYLKQGDFQRALGYGNEALAAARLVRNDDVQATARLNIGQALIAMGRHEEGKQIVESGLAYYNLMDNKPDMQAVLLEYGMALEKAGDMKGAVTAYHRERKLSNQLFEQQRQKAVYELQEKYETEKKQRQIELLSRENQVKSAELDNRRLQQRVWWLLALVMALAAVIVGLLYRKVRHANVQLQEKNQELAHQSSRDPLTALYNRRHFQEFMRHHAVTVPAPGAYKDSDLVAAMFLLDVDHFKQINDRYGHAAGDLVLTTIAATLHEVLRETDMIVRWGGEEFLAFLPSVTRGSLDHIAARVLDGIGAQRVVYQGQAIQVHVSIGFAPYPLTPLGQPLSWERSVNLVDMALYLAKAHGRNRAYGVRGVQQMEGMTLEVVEQDLERAWRNGVVDLNVVPGPQNGLPRAAA